MRWPLKLLIWLWKVSDDEVNIAPDFIVVHSYGLRNPDTLPDAEKKAVGEAVRFYHSFPRAQIVMASSDYFWPRCVIQEINLKLSLLINSGIPKERIVFLGGVKNTVEEIKRLRAFTLLKNPVILSIADQLHTRSVRSMYHEFFPEANLLVRSVAGNWDDPESPLVYGRSNWRWLAANITRHFGYLLLGEQIAAFRHPLNKK